MVIPICNRALQRSNDYVNNSLLLLQVIGVHAIFGGFVLGVIVPRENGFAVRMTERIEVKKAPFFYYFILFNQGITLHKPMFRFSPN